MRTVKLNTGVEVILDENDNMIDVKSPYDKIEYYNTSTLERFINFIKNY